MKINFVLPPAPVITGGPLAILEYANRLIKLGHDVSITTYPDIFWSGDNPFPWYNFKGKIYYQEFRNKSVASLKGNDSRFRFFVKGFKFFIKNLNNYKKLSQYARNLSGELNSNNYHYILNNILNSGGLTGLVDIMLNIGDPKTVEHINLHPILADYAAARYLMDIMPECDLNIATLWSTAFPVYLSQKGKPVYFMQHYEEVFHSNDIYSILQRFGARMSYCLPMFKVANSSWLKKVIFEKYGQDIPFSNNGIEINDFIRMNKKSQKDGIIRIVTYSRPDEWKGFGDAMAAMKEIKEKFQKKVEWHVFGFLNPNLPPNNDFSEYIFYKNLSFKELASLYATSDIVLCPSWYESFPLPPLEAMASVTAVITTEYGTEDYAFHEKNALVVKPRDIQGMLQALERLINDEKLRNKLAEEGRKTAEGFSWENAVANREKILIDIYEGNVGYDIFKSSQLGLIDCCGNEFEHAPADIQLKNYTLIQNHNQIYLIERNTKRHIAKEQMIEDLKLDRSKIIEVDDLTFFRIPTGTEIVNSSDLILKPLEVH